MKNFKSYLEEGRDAPLYHATSPADILNILKSNMLKSTVYHTKLYKNQKGISFTRNFKFAKKWRGSSIILELDQRKLSQRHKIGTVHYWSKRIKDKTRHTEKSDTGLDAKKYNEYEEFVIGDIKNLDKYIINIHIPDNSFMAQPKFYFLREHPKAKTYV
jgi:hypothetical protein